MTDYRRSVLLVPARSYEEAHLFAQLRPCECGEVTSEWELTDVAPSDTTLRIELSTPCPGCGLGRTIAFALPVRQTEVPSAHFSLPDDPPSSLFDPGEWFTFSHLYREQTDFLLQDGPTSVDDPAQWHTLLAQLTRAAAAMDEVLRFLPDDADEMPREAYFSPGGRMLRDEEPQWCTREWLTTDHAARWRLVHGFLENVPEPDTSPEVEEPAPSHVAFGLEPQILPARGEAEVWLYLRLHPCTCGEPDFDPAVGFGLNEDGPLMSVRGRCLGCGENRDYLFRVPENDLPADATDWAEGDEPSQLIDAGEWLLVAQTLGAGRPLEEDLSSDDEVQQLRYDLARSAAAIDEVLKFVPARAEAVPSLAFWTARGKEFRDAQPSLFEVDRMRAVGAAYRRMAAGQPSLS